MTGAAIVTAVVVWGIFIGGFVFSFSRMGRGKSKWED